MIHWTEIATFLRTYVLYVTKTQGLPAISYISSLFTGLMPGDLQPFYSLDLPEVRLGEG